MTYVIIFVLLCIAVYFGIEAAEERLALVECTGGAAPQHAA
jgi:hypothetical protein